MASVDLLKLHATKINSTSQEPASEKVVLSHCQCLYIQPTSSAET